MNWNWLSYISGVLTFPVFIICWILIRELIKEIKFKMGDKCVGGKTK